MNTHKLALTLTEDGKLMLTDLPFHAGDTVEIILLEHPNKQFSQVFSSEYPLKGTVLRYDDPFEPAVPIEDWDALQ
jgi:hypothetical protein